MVKVSSTGTAWPIVSIQVLGYTFLPLWLSTKVYERYTNCFVFSPRDLFMSPRLVRQLLESCAVCKDFPYKIYCMNVGAETKWLISFHLIPHMTVYTICSICCLDVCRTYFIVGSAGEFLLEDSVDIRFQFDR